MPRRRHIVRLERGDIASLVEDAAAGDAEHSRQQIEERRLAGAVRADQRVDAAALHVEADILHRDEAGEGLRQMFGAQQHIVGHGSNERLADRSPEGLAFLRT